MPRACTTTLFGWDGHEVYVLGSCWAPAWCLGRFEGKIRRGPFLQMASRLRAQWLGTVWEECAYRGYIHRNQGSEVKMGQRAQERLMGKVMPRKQVGQGQGAVAMRVQIIWKGTHRSC